MSQPATRRSQPTPTAGADRSGPWALSDSDASPEKGAAVPHLPSADGPSANRTGERAATIRSAVPHDEDLTPVLHTRNKRINP